MSDSLQPHGRQPAMGFPRQEYWSGLSFPSLGDLRDPGIEPMSLALAGGFSTTKPLGMSASLLPKNILESSAVTVTQSTGQPAYCQS